MEPPKTTARIFQPNNSPKQVQQDQNVRSKGRKWKREKENDPNVTNTYTKVLKEEKHSFHIGVYTLDLPENISELIEKEDTIIAQVPDDVLEAVHFLKHMTNNLPSSVKEPTTEREAALLAKKVLSRTTIAKLVEDLSEEEHFFDDPKFLEYILHFFYRDETYPILIAAAENVNSATIINQIVDTIYEDIRLCLDDDDQVKPWKWSGAFSCSLSQILSFQHNLKINEFARFLVRHQDIIDKEKLKSMIKGAKILDFVQKQGEFHENMFNNFLGKAIWKKERFEHMSSNANLIRSLIEIEAR